MGLLEINFSHIMNKNLTIDYLNLTYLDIFVTPNLLAENNERDVNLTWDLVSFENKTLLIQLNFSSPLDISASVLHYDNITVHVINFTDIFVSNSGLFLNRESKNLTSKIKKQMI